MKENTSQRTYRFFNDRIHYLGDFLKKVSFPGFEKVPVYHVFWFFVAGLKKGALNIRATAIAFSFLLALGPALVFFLAMLPYIATLLILLLISLKDPRKLNAPAMLAEPYKRGER